MYDDICYKKPFLKEVIARVDFSPTIDNIEKSLPPKLSKELSTHFPIAEPADTIAQELQVSAEELHHRQTRMKHWNFYGKERQRHLSLAAPFVFVSYSKYKSYEDMREHFSAVVDAVGGAFPDTIAIRFGIRYINSIEIPEVIDPSSLSDYICASLLGTMPFFEEPKRLSRLVSIAELKYDDVDVRFQFGMPNPDYPAAIKRQQFVLDFDAYIQESHDISGSIQYMEKAHERIQSLFEKSITERLREKMNA